MTFTKGSHCHGYMMHSPQTHRKGTGREDLLGMLNLEEVG